MGPPLREGWLYVHASHSRTTQNNIRLPGPQHPHSPGSHKQCQDLSTRQMRAQDTTQPSVSWTPCQAHVRSRGMQEALTVGPLNCIAESSLSLAESAGSCFIISAICLFALQSSAPPGYAQRLLPGLQQLCWVSVNKPQAGTRVGRGKAGWGEERESKFN